MRPQRLSNYEQRTRPVRLPWTDEDGRERRSPIFSLRTASRFMHYRWTKEDHYHLPLGECWWEMCQ